MPRKPKIVKDSDNFALKEARRWVKDRGIGVGYSRAEMERMFEGILSLQAMRDLEASRGIRRAAREC